VRIRENFLNSISILSFEARCGRRSHGNASLVDPRDGPERADRSRPDHPHAILVGDLLNQAPPLFDRADVMRLADAGAARALVSHGAGVPVVTGHGVG